MTVSESSSSAATPRTTLSQVVAHAKAYGFVFPSSEIYGQLRSVYDYGPHGVVLRERIQRLWQLSFRLAPAQVVGLDSAIFMSPKVWEASGHAGCFADLFVDHLQSKKRYRLDELLGFAEPTEAKDLEESMAALGEGADPASYEPLLARINCPVAGNSHWGPVRRLELMCRTSLGATAEDAQDVYLRPETAQGIYVNYLNIQQALRLKMPFGVAQLGKAFRNELIARQFLFRMREFNQMEMQWFCAEEEASRWFEHWLDFRLKWYALLGISSSSLRAKPHIELAHYARAATDIEYLFPFGWREIEGIHNRGDYDLLCHSKLSGKRLRYAEGNYTPHVIETSAGVDRLVLMLLCHAFREEGDEAKKRTYLAFPPWLAPVQVAVFPLVRQEELVALAKDIANELRLDFSLIYEESASIGKRYARQDLIGTPYCVTIDHQSLAEGSVTLRKRDDASQERIPRKDLFARLQRECSLENQLKAFSCK